MVNPSVQLSTWAERIPAAIEKAEGLISRRIDSYKGRRDFTTGEVALAKALWLAEIRIEQEWGPWDDWPKCDALRAFCEKVEILR